MIIEAIIGSIVLIGGLGFGAYSFFHKEKPKIYSNLNHIKVPLEWDMIKYLAWAKASNTLKIKGVKGITKCNKIVIEAGIKINPATGQWGRPTSSDFWYAGLGGVYVIQIVGTPNKLPYDRSHAILTHEVAETILHQDPVWSKKTIEERNKFLWTLGL